MNDQVIIALAKKFANESKLSPSEVKQGIEDYLDENPEALDQAAVEAIAGQVLDNIVLIQNQQPTSDKNKLWILSDTVQETDVPTYQEFTDLNNEVDGLRSAINSNIDLTEYDWVLGTINANTAAEMDSDTRIRSEFIRVNNGGTITLTGNANCLIVFIYSATKAYISSSAWDDGNTFNIPATAYYIRILIRKTTANASMTESEIETQVARCSYHAILPSEVYQYRNLQDKVDEDAVKVLKIYKELGLVEELTKADATYNLRKKTNVGTITDQTDGTRLRIVFDLTEVQVCAVTAQATGGKGLAVNGYNDLIAAIKANNSYTDSITGSTYTTSMVAGITQNSKYISISLCKADSSVITDAERESLFEALSVLITVYPSHAKRLTNIESGLAQSFAVIKGEDIGLIGADNTEIGTINSSTGDEQTSTTRIRSAYIDVTNFSIVKAIVKSGYKYAIDWFDDEKTIITTVPSAGMWIKNDAEYTIPDGITYVRFLIATIDDDTIERSEYVNANLFGVYKIVSDIEELELPLGYSDAEAARKNFGTSNESKNNLKYLPAFIHLSDIHGDAVRFTRACTFTKQLNADALISTGDMVRYNSTDDYSYIVNAAKGILYIPCMGNHDVWSFTTEQAMYEKYIDPFKDDYTLPSGVTYPTYFYKDITSKSIRIISLNQFQSDSSNPRQHYYVHFHQEQITWFVNALLSTPQGYGVIVLMHTPEANPVADSTYTKFKQPVLAYTYSLNYKPITEIVDAFISGGTLEKTYTNGSGRTPETFTVDADFSSKNTGVEFIAYMTGHLHSDNVYYVPNTTNKQLMLNITCGCAWINKKTDGTPGTNYANYAELSDLPRSEKGPNQDAVNLYVIDRGAKKVRIARIGANQMYDLSAKRDYMAIPYADS